MGNAGVGSTKNLLILLMSDDEKELIKILKEEKKSRDLNQKINAVFL